MKANSDKSHILLSCSEPSTALIDGSSIESNTKEILLGITIDRDLKFDEHVNNLCKKACQKLNALVRLAPFMNVDKKRMIMKAFIESQFGYCPLVWMFHSRGLNNKMNRMHKKALRITYNGKASSFPKLLEKDNSVTIHHRNIKIQAWPATLLKKRLWHRCFPVNFEKFLRTPFLIEHLWLRLLSIHDQKV